MELINCTLNSKNLIDERIVLTVGEFDGIHYAHRRLIEHTIKLAKENNVKSALMTFYPHPAYVLGKRKDDGYITPIEEKIHIIEKLGIDYLIVVEFNLEIAQLSYRDFEVRILNQFKIERIVCGFDYHYGHKGQGNCETLKEHYKVSVIEEIKEGNDKVGSTLVRSYLEQGNMEGVIKLLNRPFSITGKVVKGNNIGSKIGMATANLYLDPKYYTLKFGVYSVYVYFNDQRYLGVCNIGHNPSFNYVEKPRIEVHILDFNQIIYEDIITIEFMHYLRPEFVYPNSDELIKQINNDILKTKELL